MAFRATTYLCPSFSRHKKYNYYDLWNFLRPTNINQKNIHKYTHQMWTCWDRKKRKPLGTLKDLLWMQFFLTTKRFPIHSDLKNLRPHFQNSFVPSLFHAFFARLQNGTQTSYWKPYSRVLLSRPWILHIFIHFWAFWLLCGLVSNISKMFLRDSEVFLERCDSYSVFFLLFNKKIKHLYLKRNL